MAKIASMDLVLVSQFNTHVVMAGRLFRDPGGPSAGSARGRPVPRAWACPPDHYFEAHTKYLQLADKASRTVAMLTERLDQHRGRGHQQIVVKHVTVNADQAMVAESIVTGDVPRKETSLLAATGADSPMEILQPTQKEAVPTGGGTKSK
jgi:hypothetical protein